MADLRKNLLLQAKINLKGSGILLKKLPAKLLQEYGKLQGSNPPNPQLQSTLQRMENLRIIEEIATWGRQGLDGDYLKELLEGLAFITEPNFLVAFKSVFEEGANTFVPVGFISYGTYNPNRQGTTRRGEKMAWAQRVDGVSVENITAKKVAEIEGVITRPNMPAALGVGKALVEFAVADICSRKSRGNWRYTNIVMFTNQRRIETITEPYGFTTKGYRYVNKETGQDITNRLVREGVADRPTSSKCLMFSMVSLNEAANAAQNRVVSTRVCPLTAKSEPALKMWQVCR